MHSGITARPSPVSGQILSPVETRSRARGFQLVDAGSGTGPPSAFRERGYVSGELFNLLGFVDQIEREHFCGIRFLHFQFQIFSHLGQLDDVLTHVFLGFGERHSRNCEWIGLAIIGLVRGRRRHAIAGL